MNHRPPPHPPRPTTKLRAVHDSDPDDEGNGNGSGNGHGPESRARPHIGGMSPDAAMPYVEQALTVQAAAIERNANSAKDSKDAVERLTASTNAIVQTLATIQESIRDGFVRIHDKVDAKAQLAETRLETARAEIRADIAEIRADVLSVQSQQRREAHEIAEIERRHGAQQAKLATLEKRYVEAKIAAAQAQRASKTEEELARLGARALDITLDGEKLELEQQRAELEARVKRRNLALAVLTVLFGAGGLVWMFVQAFVFGR